MKPAVHVDDLARAEREQVLDNGGDGFADVLGPAPAFDRRQPAADKLVIFFFHWHGHVGGDNTRANLIEIGRAHV